MEKSLNFFYSCQIYHEFGEGIAKGVNGLKNLIEESRYIEAAETKAGLQFYQTDDRKVKYYGKSEKVENKHDIIIPDVTFFNTENDPILFIEVFVTHKVDNTKLEKIRKLDIDTIEIKIPIDASLQDIEKLFDKTTKTQWIYNHKEAYETYKYIPIPTQNPEGLSLSDKEQNNIFGRKWSYECRANQLNTTIRAIRGYLQGKSYRAIKDRLEGELSQVKRSGKREQEAIDELRAGIQTRFDNDFRDRRENLEAGRADLEDEEADLDKRYNKKKNKLEKKTRKFDRGFDKLRNEIQNGIDNEFKDRESKFKTEEGEFEEEDRAFRGKQDEFDREFDKLREGVDRGLGKRSNKLRKEAIQVDNKEQRVRESQTEIRERTDVLKQKNRDARSKQEEFEKEIGEYETATQRIKARNGKGDGELPKQITKIIQRGGIIQNWKTRLGTVSKYKNALRRIKEGNYKT